MPKKSRITVLADVDDPIKKEYDPVVPQVASALRRGGYGVSVQSVHGDLRKLVGGLSRRKPDLVFNLVETFGDNLHGDIGVTAVLELMQIPFTGSGAAQLFLQQNKAITKKILAFHSILCPDFAVFYPDSDMETSGNLRMPLFVKPLRADASLGIDSKALVRNAMEMMEQIARIHKEFKDAALVEEYIEGREFYVGVLGTTDSRALPPIEMDFSGLPEGAPKVLDSKAKWSHRSAEYKGTKAVLADLPDELTARLQKISLDAYRALQLNGYGRVDLRLTETGDIYVIEANANCYLERSSEFVTAAEAAEISFNDLILTIVDDAFAKSGLKHRSKAAV